MARVYTGGTFDLFHVGHLDLLRWCREIAGPDGKVLVSLNTDAFIERYKGAPPVNSQLDRRTMLQACKYVDEVVWNVGDEDSKLSILACKPDYIVIGSDWATRDYYKQMGFTQEWLNERKIALVYIPHVIPISSTKIKKDIKK